MLAYIIRRLLTMIPTLIAISVISFTIIQLPPGDFLTTYIANLGASGELHDQSELESLRDRFGLDKPVYIQYFKWAWNFIHGDFGHSFEWNKPVSLIDRRAPGPHDYHFHPDVALHLGGCCAHRDLLRGATVFVDGLSPHHCGILRSGNSQFPLCAGLALVFLRVSSA